MEIFRNICNSYEVNSYLLIADDGTGVLIDPAFENERELSVLQRMIDENDASLVAIIATHTHADHVMGAKLLMDTYPDAAFLMHKEAEPLYKMLNDYSMIMGFKKRELATPTGYVTDNEILRFSDIELQVFHTPGHAPGSICMYCKTEDGDVVFTGDVLFHSSIGRTDLPGGSFDVLRTSIIEKLFTLPPDTLVLTGHGDATSIEFEKENNPFLQ